MKQPWEKQISLAEFQRQNPLPEYPGVYFFIDADGGILYIGKATSLRDRVKSYFRPDLLATRGPKVRLMLERIARIGYRTTDSVLEALLLESELIRHHQPPHNTDAKDDKSYNQVVITQEAYPRVLLVRSRDIAQGKFTLPVKHAFGPFTQGGALKEALRIVRRLFPYRDQCVPYAELSAKQRAAARGCFSAQIGLCPGVCVGAVTRADYQKTMRHIRLLFEGKKQTIVKQLERDMAAAAARQEFERAQEIKKTLFGLQHIQDMALVKADINTHDRQRLEAYDVAHLRGEASVGVMTVVQNGRSQPSEYRQFRLRGRHVGNDLTALQEILRRRFRHPEWPFPDLLVIDGGQAQYAAAEAVLAEYALTIPILSVVKDARHRPDHLLGPAELIERFKKEILLANAEAHRFAITFHRKRRGEAFLGASGGRV